VADNPFLRAALYYAGRNWPVFPIWWVKGAHCACGKADCAHPGKHPIGKLAPKGRNSATTDPKKIKEWWKQYPKANIGLPTGPESGLVVVDIDPRNGGNRQKLDDLGGFPPTPTAQTGGGGEHILLRHPGRKVKSKSELGGIQGIDQKGDGGYIVAPPSNHISGGVYAWKIKPDTPLAAIPAWLMPLLLQGEDKAQGRRQAHQGGGAGPGGEFSRYAHKALADELAKLARTPEGQRNAQLNQSAFALGQLVGAGALDRGSVEAGLSGVAAVIGLGEAETRATLKSGLDRGISEPRTLPEKPQGRGNGARKGVDPASPEKSKLAGPGEGEAPKYWLCGHCYFVDRGRLVLEKVGREGEPAIIPLANFQARIEAEGTRDDGLLKVKEYHITGSLETGRALAPARISAKEFDSLKWIGREWGAAASVAPGRSLGPHLGNAIQAHSQGFKRRTLFEHTGWRKIGGAWRYLHGGGAIGPGEPVEVDLGENLGNYRLPEPGGLEAAQASLRFLDIAPWKITAPLLACAYLAPFVDLVRVNFSIWLFGPSGSFKSTLAALALSHFGNFDVGSLPANWLSTPNSLEKLTFILKDTLCVIDDFVPPATSKEAQVQMEKAGRIIYQRGNRSARGRLSADLKARENHYPRGLIISTGEMLLPGNRQSATARYLGIELDQKKTPIPPDLLTAAQGEAHLYAGAMAAYLAGLASRLEDVQAEIKDLWKGYRIAFQNGDHARLAEILSWLAIGFELFSRFQVRMGAISEDQAYEMDKRAWKVFKALGEKHGRQIEGERPTTKFLAVLNELFLTSRIYAESKDFQGTKPPRESLLGWQGNDPARNSYLVGYADETTIYLLPNKVMGVVSEELSKQREILPLGKNEMLRALAREGLIVPTQNGENTQSVRIQGGKKRVICLPRHNLGHVEELGNETE